MILGGKWRHTRFVDFPKHKHDYVEIFYCLSGSVTHVINEEEIASAPENCYS